jgi:hypothetical protein
MGSPYKIGGWPHRPNIYGTAAQVHAVGQITLAYNSLEASMGGIFQFVMSTEKTFSQRLFHKLNNRDRIDLLTAVVKAAGFHATAKDHLIHLIHGYEICTENRNILMHSTFQDTYQGVLHLSKRSSNNPSIENKFQIPLADLRAVADQVHQFNHFALDLMFWIGMRKAFPARYRRTLTTPRPDEVKYPNARKILEAVPEIGALPDKPPKPRTLTPHPLPAGPKGAIPLPRSSRAKH